MDHAPGSGGGGAGLASARAELPHGAKPDTGKENACANGAKPKPRGTPAPRGAGLSARSAPPARAADVSVHWKEAPAKSPIAVASVEASAAVAARPAAKVRMRRVRRRRPAAARRRLR
jgi:hypothetical protein